MNIRFPRLASGVLAVAIVAGAAVAVAQTGPSAPTAGAPGAAPMPPHPEGMHRDGPRMRGGHRMMMELDRLKTSLRLTASQSALWERAQATMAPPADGRQKMRATHERMTAMLDDPNFDPRRLAAEMDSADSERRARMTSMRDAWFAVYDSLNPVQRGQVREFLRSRLGRAHGMERHHEGMRGMHGGMEGRDGNMARPLMSASPPPAPTR